MMGGLAKLSILVLMAVCSWGILLMGAALLLTIAAALS